MDKHTVQIRRSIAMVSLAAALAIGGALAWEISGSHSVLGAQREVTLKLASATNLPAPTISLNEGFSAVVEPLLPAVVSITSSKMVKTEQSELPSDPIFRQFFGDQGGPQAPSQERERGLGSGVIVTPDGYILTERHVVDGATDVEVTLKDKRQLKAEVIGTDPSTDVAVLKIPATGLASVTLGDSTKLKVGDIVLAVGDPFGLGETVTMGIISATSRRARDLEDLQGPSGYQDFIQTDAAINPGNARGARW